MLKKISSNLGLGGGFRRLTGEICFALVLMVMIPAVVSGAPAGNGTSPTDSTADAADNRSIRGTERPIGRNASPLQWTGRTLLFVPYAATRMVTFPLERLTWANERYRLSEKIAATLFGTYEYGRTEVGTFFGYETGIGFTLAGLSLRQEDFILPGTQLDLKGGYFSPDQNVVSLHYRGVPRTIQPWLVGRFDNREDRPIHGIGPGSGEDDFEVNMKRVAAEGGVVVGANGEFQAMVTGFIRTHDLSEPSSENDAAIAFPEISAVAEESRYAGGEVAIAWDGRNNGPFSSKGGYLKVAAGFDQALSDEDEDYDHHSVEAQGFLNLFNDSRVLAFRAFAEGIRTDDAAQVPWTEQEHLGGRDGIRGYSRNRFTDLKMLQLTAEYRYRVTEHVFGALFGDWGAVAPGWEEIHPNDLESAIGLRLLFGGRGDRFAVSVARGREEIAIYVGTESVFSTRPRRFR